MSFYQVRHAVQRAFREYESDLLNPIDPKVVDQCRACGTQYSYQATRKHCTGCLKEVCESCWKPCECGKELLCRDCAYTHGDMVLSVSCFAAHIQELYAAELSPVDLITLEAHGHAA